MVAKWTLGLPDSEVSPQTRYERREAIKAKVAAQLRTELFVATVNAFPQLQFQFRPVTSVDGAIGINIGVADQETTLPRLERWAYVHSHTLQSLLDLVGDEAGRRVARARTGDVSVEVDTVGKVVGDAADLD